VSAPGPVLLTVGHSTLSINDFVRLLRTGFVSNLVDVRRHPGSRRSPQFSAEALAGSLEEAGIDYVWLGEELGGRRTAKDAAATARDNSAWRHRSFRAYADFMDTATFQDGLKRLASSARDRRTAIMCAETHPSRCHRRLVSDAMLARGWRVFHLLPGRPPEQHRLSEHAVVVAARVTYPGPGA